MATHRDSDGALTTTRWPPFWPAIAFRLFSRRRRAHAGILCRLAVRAPVAPAAGPARQTQCARLHLGLSALAPTALSGQGARSGTSRQPATVEEGAHDAVRRLPAVAVPGRSPETAG